jgi:hypothetical protein
VLHQLFINCDGQNDLQLLDTMIGEFFNRPSEATIFIPKSADKLGQQALIAFSSYMEGLGAKGLLPVGKRHKLGC